MGPVEAEAMSEAQAAALAKVTAAMANAEKGGAEIEVKDDDDEEDDDDEAGGQVDHDCFEGAADMLALAAATGETKYHRDGHTETK